MSTDTLAALSHTLTQFSDDHRLVFATDQTGISHSYHITELHLAQISAIDCAGHTEQRSETVLQLRDSRESTAMTIGKALSIAQTSTDRVPGLDKAPLFVEYAPRDLALRRYRIRAVSAKTQQVQLNLSSDHAICRPAQRSGCCGPDPQTAACCA